MFHRASLTKRTVLSHTRMVLLPLSCQCLRWREKSTALALEVLKRTALPSSHLSLAAAHCSSFWATLSMFAPSTNQVTSTKEVSLLPSNWFPATRWILAKQMAKRTSQMGEHCGGLVVTPSGSPSYPSTLMMTFRLRMRLSVHLTRFSSGPMLRIFRRRKPLATLGGRCNAHEEGSSLGYTLPGLGNRHRYRVNC